MKPYSLMRAKQGSDEIRPMFGPSGVSIGRCGRSAWGARRAPRTAARSRDKPPGPRADRAPLVGDLAERVGLVHELRKLAGAEEFADGGHHRLGVHQVVRHAVDISWYTDIFSLMARSMRTRPMRNWFSSSSPTARVRGGCPGGRCRRRWVLRPLPSLGAASAGT